ncbi:MAG TPA: hypothetical protein VJN43_07135 [Bryobacteraceae bacterium]|nr:hypothetical protein [Bryobacteraceae bacterium]
MLTDSQEVRLNLHPPRHPWDEEEEESSGHLHGIGWWLALLVVLAALGGAVWYFHPVLAQQISFPGQVANLKDSLAATNKRMDAADQKTGALVSAWDAVNDQVNKLQSRVDSTIQLARKQTQQALEQTRRQLQAELDRRLHGMETRIIRVEVGRENDQSRVAKLEKQLDSLRQEYRGQVVRLEQERDQALDRVNHQLSGLDQKVQSDSHDLTAVRTQVDRRRLDFEAGVNHTKEIAPGVTLQISHTDVNYQRFDGYVFLMPDRRTIWIRRQSADSPVVLYNKEDGRSRELVITRVTKYSVVGYLLVPEHQG